MPAPILTAHDATGHIHLIIGSNPLASARCTRSTECGAKAILIAPPEAHLHYSLAKRVEDGQVEWRKKPFMDEDLQSLGRLEVDHVVDAVFVTLGGKVQLSMVYLNRAPSFADPGQAHTSRRCVASFASLSMLLTPLISAPLRCSLLIQTDPFRLG